MGPEMDSELSRRFEIGGGGEDVAEFLRGAVDGAGVGGTQKAHVEMGALLDAAHHALEA